MNQLDAAAVPMDIFHREADLRPFIAQLPNVTLDNLLTPPSTRNAALAFWMTQTEKQDLSHQDMANSIIPITQTIALPPAFALPNYCSSQPSGFATPKALCGCLAPQALL
jgi:hypothetical protein